MSNARIVLTALKNLIADRRGVSSVMLAVSLPAAALFVLGLICLIGGLLVFLREIYLATIHLRLGPFQNGARKRK